jgi:hypothetical protein
VSELSSNKEWNSVQWKEKHVMHLKPAQVTTPPLAAAELLWLLFQTDVWLSIKGQADGQVQIQTPRWGVQVLGMEQPNLPHQVSSESSLSWLQDRS